MTLRLQHPFQGHLPTNIQHLVVSFLIILSFVSGIVPISLSYLDPSTRLITNFSEGSLIRQLQISTLLLTACVLLYQHRSVIWNSMGCINPFMLLTVLYCLLSTLWSPFPLITLKRVFVLAGLLVVGFAIIPPIGRPYQLINTMRVTLTTICALSMIVALTVPFIGVDYALGGAWRGITWQKNLLGGVAAYATLLWVYEWTSGNRSRLICTLGAMFCLFILLMTKSSTATLLTLLSCALYVYAHRSWLHGLSLNTVIMLVLSAVVPLFIHFYFVLTGQLPTWNNIIGPIASMFGKGTDLTGRTEIWGILLLSIQQHPLLGIGYDAFWLGAGSPAQYIADAFGWMPSHGHNGYLDLLNELGGLGLSLFFLALIWHFVSIFRLMRYDRKEAALYLAMAILILSTNFTESDFLKGTQMQNIILLFTSATISGRLYLMRSRDSALSLPKMSSSLKQGKQT